MQGAKDEDNLDFIDDPERRLATEIIRGAVSDWEDLIHEKCWRRWRQNPEKNFAEIRKFFTDGLCDILLGSSHITADQILELLEDMLDDALSSEDPNMIKNFHILGEWRYEKY